MQTQRVNVYISGANLQVYFIEEFNPELREWFTVGDTYGDYKLASVVAETHNLRELIAKLGK